MLLNDGPKIIKCHLHMVVAYFPVPSLLVAIGKPCHPLYTTLNCGVQRVAGHSSVRCTPWWRISCPRDDMSRWHISEVSLADEDPSVWSSVNFLGLKVSVSLRCVWYFWKCLSAVYNWCGSFEQFLRLLIVNFNFLEFEMNKDFLH